MINWEKLYYKVCERISDKGHEHHIIPKHTGMESDITVKLTFRDHVLAHYIRYKWLHEKGDRQAFQILTRKNIPKFNDEKNIIYKKKVQTKEKTNSIHPRIIIISTPIIIVKEKKEMKKSKIIRDYTLPRKKIKGLDQKLKHALRSKISLD